MAMPVTDHDAALTAIAALAHPSPAQLAAQHAIAAILRNGEPFVPVDTLFEHFDTLYFRNLLRSRVELLWSPRLTLVRFSLSPRFMLYFRLVSQPISDAGLVVAPPAFRRPYHAPADAGYSALASASSPGTPPPAAGPASG
jgi:hypothetical protein